jgi:uncharacterized protein YceK
MRDLAFVLLIVVFFAIATAYVRGCSSVVGSDSASDPDQGGDEQELAS